MQLDFSGKTAVVTGGANGIGLAAAKAIARCGGSVWIFDLEREKPGEVAASFGAKGCVVDVTDLTSLESAFQDCGVPDVLVANAGRAYFAGVTETAKQEWDRTIEVNLTGMFHAVQAAARAMKKQRSGSIVMTISTNAYDGEAELLAYNASKAGLLGILHTAANELGPYGIRVNGVCPGLIRTRLTVDGFFSKPEVCRPYFQNTALGRGGEPEEVANAIAFLASDLASYITGTVLLVDGGQMTAKFGIWNDRIAEFAGDHWRLRD
jgi:NAD(P)-dependent dehydrogenase (short-subunit alcohol dehydrogenase family)